MHGGQARLLARAAAARARHKAGRWWRQHRSNLVVFLDEQHLASFATAPPGCVAAAAAALTARSLTHQGFLLLLVTAAPSVASLPHTQSLTSRWLADERAH